MRAAGGRAEGGCSVVVPRGTCRAGRAGKGSECLQVELRSARTRAARTRATPVRIAFPLNWRMSCSAPTHVLHRRGIKGKRERFDMVSEEEERAGCA